MRHFAPQRPTFNHQCAWNVKGIERGKRLIYVENGSREEHHPPHIKGDAPTEILGCLPCGSILSTARRNLEFLDLFFQFPHTPDQIRQLLQADPLPFGLIARCRRNSQNGPLVGNIAHDA